MQWSSVVSLLVVLLFTWVAPARAQLQETFTITGTMYQPARIPPNR